MKQNAELTKKHSIAYTEKEKWQYCEQGEELMFWFGLIIGITVGANFGVLLMALFKARKNETDG